MIFYMKNVISKSMNCQRAARDRDLAKEGGVFGIGGERVSEAEAAALKDIATALDIETASLSSTRLSQQYPEATPAVFARHDQILRQVIEAHNGFVFQIIGDSFSAAFPSASDALCAALAAQRSLHQEPWSPAPVRVRMRIHTGAAQAEVTLAAFSGQYEEARLWFEKAMDAFREAGADFNILINKSNLAHLERQLGRHQQALERYRETIEGFHEVGQLGAVAHQLECFGFLAIEDDQYERALKLFAAADALREKVSAPMTSEEQIYFEEQIGVLRQKLDPHRFHQICATGRALTMEQALAFALGKNNE